MMRLDKYLSECLEITRSESKIVLKKGRVTVNGTTVKSGDLKVGDEDEVCVDGEALSHTDFVYIMLNKPEGVVSASRDNKNSAYTEVTVTDLVREAFPRRELFPAGRLDKTSTGFILLTDDGKFAHDLLAPGRHVPKTYTVELDTPLTQEMISDFAEGPTLVDGTKLDPAEVRAVSDDGRIVEVTLHQGVYHQIKRMFGLRDAGVNALHRTKIGGLQLDPALEPGQWRLITEEEKGLIM